MGHRTGEHCARGLALVLALLTLGAGRAAADSIPYFNGPGRVGFENELRIPADLGVVSQLRIPGLVFKQKIKKVKFNDGVYTIRLKLTVKNQTGSALDDLLLLITALSQPSAVAPDTPILLDLGGGRIDDLSIARLPGSPERFFAALDVGHLSNKRKFKAWIEYQVVGDLERGRVSPLEYTIGTAPTPIPEPGTALLLAGSLVLLAARRRALLETARR